MDTNSDVRENNWGGGVEVCDEMTLSRNLNATKGPIIWKTGTREHFWHGEWDKSEAR